MPARLDDITFLLIVHVRECSALGDVNMEGLLIMVQEQHVIREAICGSGADHNSDLLRCHLRHVRGECHCDFVTMFEADEQLKRREEAQQKVDMNEAIDERRGSQALDDALFLANQPSWQRTL
jgi:hypothetical protein